MIPLLFFATCGAPEISDDWIDDYEAVESPAADTVVYQANSDHRFEYGVSNGGGQLSFAVPEGWQVTAGSDELIVTVTHLSSGTRVDFFVYYTSVGLPVPRSDCEWGYSDPVSASPFRGVESVMLASCLLHESGDRVQALGFEQSGVLWQIETQLKVGYLALGLEVSEELFSEVSF